MRRTIFKSAEAATREVELLLQNLLIAEVLSPSSELWLSSPWVTDIEVVDNRAAGFASIDPTWPTRWIRMSEVLGCLGGHGTRVVVAVRSDEHNLAFRQRVELAFAAVGCSDRLTVVVDDSDEQHEKGLLGDDYFVSGSMNFTVSGLRLNGEVITVTREPGEIAAARIAFRERFGLPQ